MSKIISYLIPFEKISEFKFESRPEPISSGLKLSFRLCQILLVLEYNCRGYKSSQKKMHFFLRNLDNLKKIELMVDCNVGNYNDIQKLGINFNPYISRAIKQALMLEFLEVTSAKSFGITEKGKILLKFINDNESLFIFEKEYLSEIGKKFSNKIIEKIIKK